MDFEELKVEIPVDNDDEEEKDFPFNLVTKRDMRFITHFFHLFKHLWIFCCCVLRHRKDGMRTNLAVLLLDLTLLPR